MIQSYPGLHILHINAQTICYYFFSTGSFRGYDRNLHCIIPTALISYGSYFYFYFFSFLFYYLFSIGILLLPFFLFIS